VQLVGSVCLITLPQVDLKYYNEHVCMSVCLLAYLEDHTQNFARNFLYALTVAMSQSSEDGAICYVFPVL